MGKFLCSFDLVLEGKGLEEWDLTNKATERSPGLIQISISQQKLRKVRRDCFKAKNIQVWEPKVRRNELEQIVMTKKCKRDNIN